MNWFPCRACAAKDAATLAQQSEVLFLREQLKAMSDKLVAITDVRAYAVMQPRAPADPDKAKTPGQHTPGMIRARRVDRPSDAEVERHAEQVRRRQEHAQVAEDPGMPEPGPSREQIEAGFQRGDS